MSKVAVLGGGRSSEHDVSLASAESVANGLVKAGHEVVTVTIGYDGVWRLSDNSELALHPGRGLLGVEVVFPVLHGPYGEDGTIQGLLECLDIAYVGSGVLGSALCMNKAAFKAHIAQLGLPQVEYQKVLHIDWLVKRELILAQLSQLELPVFVKPSCLGSSIGMSKVRHVDDLGAALDRAFEHDPCVLVEAAVMGVEVECAVLGDRFSAPKLSEPGEISYQTEWYDYATKYTSGAMELIVPARISECARKQVQRLALAVFQGTECDGLARIDCFVEGDSVFVNELNTIPGFTETSVFGQLFAASGIAWSDLLNELVQLALRRRKSSRSYAH